MAAYINKTAKENKSVVIAYDSRNMSCEFAFLAADILSGEGIKTYVFDKLMPTPVISFAVRYLKTSAGIVITASHNPKEYNGYKVYNEKGCQITDVAAKEILSETESCGYFDKICVDKSIIEVLDDTVLNEFLKEIQKYSLIKSSGENTPKIVYIPLNGTGNIPVRKILEIIGIKNVIVIPEQEQPNGNFPTCPYPNPEEKAALNARSTLAKSLVADKSMWETEMNEENASDWIKGNTHCINILVDASCGDAAIELIEAVMHYAFNPRYEGALHRKGSR